MSRVLIVEDDTDLRYLYETMLSRHGHEVITTDSCAQALLALTNLTFDLMLLDMPPVNGNALRVIEFAQSDVRLRDLPIIVLSSRERMGERVRALGVDEFLIKPVHMQRLLGLVDELAGPPEPQNSVSLHDEQS